MPFSCPGTSHPAQAGTALLNPGHVQATQNPPRALQGLSRHLHNIRFVSSWLAIPLQAQESSWSCKNRILPCPTVPLPSKHHPFIPEPALHLAEKAGLCLETHFPQLHKPVWTSQLVTLTTGTAQSFPQSSSQPPKGSSSAPVLSPNSGLSLRISRVNMGQARR